MRKTRKVHPAAKVVLLAFSVYAAFTLISLQAKITDKENEMITLQDRIEEQQILNREVQDILSNPDDSDVVAQIAREKLGYIAPGQRVFVDISSK